jgi:NitT/TauT family transport system permease protein
MSTLAQEVAAQPAPRRVGRSFLLRIAPPSVSLAIGLVAWEIAGRVFDQPFFPPVSVVLERLGQMFGEGVIVANLGNSFVNLAVGYSSAILFGITVGILMGAYRKVEMALDMYIYALLTAPSLVFAPIFFALFGLGRASIIGVIFFYTAFIVTVNTSAAIRNVPIPLVEMARSYGATERQLVFKVIVPAALPLIMAGLRLGMARAVKGMVTGEMFIAFVGLGAIVEEASERFDATTVLAVLIVIIIVALVATKSVELLDRRVTAWLPSTARQTGAGRRRDG